MRFAHSLILLAPALALAASLPPGSPPSVTDDNGIIIAPTDGTSVIAGDSFAFSVRNAPQHSGICHAPWTTVNVYILAYKPTTADLNSTFGFSDYLWYFGEYTIFNDGDITPPPGIPDVPVPPTLNTPDLGQAISGDSIHLAVIEDLGQCDPFEDVDNISLDSRALLYTE
ncbi:hypothetical protein PsYK624_142380 [Phanerochaete sordida]|uniref:Uncharacterized protein n=1 Tax=Phanerochaete sordida TaxID=48140 RepID=A0A9P3GN25_9APHY|nr:hypothetical protein PsYK624_142380 [Phanerochaete sordida]